MDLFLFPIVLLCAAFNEFYRHFARNKFLLMAFISSRAQRPANRLFLPGICFDWSGVENTLQDKKLPLAQSGWENQGKSINTLMQVGSCDNFQ